MGTHVSESVIRSIDAAMEEEEKVKERLRAEIRGSLPNASEEDIENLLRLKMPPSKIPCFI